MLEDMAVIDELTEFRKGYVENLCLRAAMAVAPLRYRANAVLIVRNLILDGRVRNRYAEREIVLHHAAIAAGHHEFGLVHMEIVVLRRFVIGGATDAKGVNQQGGIFA